MEQNRKEIYTEPLLMKHEQLVDITGSKSGEKRGHEKRGHEKRGHEKSPKHHHYHGKRH
jgi:hypothetical protein